MKNIILLSFLALSISSFSQCDIHNRLLPDGTMHYFMEPQVFYFTQAKELKGGIITDKENYFIAMQPVPFPEKSQGKKLKENLEIKLSNDKIYSLPHFDTQYMDHDSTMQLLYLIDMKDVDDFLNFETIQVKIDMKGTEGIRTYVFKLHKKAIQEQLDCFLNEEKNKEKKK
jgi:hypothetical protein